MDSHISLQKLYHPGIYLEFQGSKDFFGKYPILERFQHFVFQLSYIFSLISILTLKWILKVCCWSPLVFLSIWEVKTTQCLQFDPYLLKITQFQIVGLFIFFHVFSRHWFFNDFTVNVSNKNAGFLNTSNNIFL